MALIILNSLKFYCLLTRTIIHSVLNADGRLVNAFIRLLNTDSCASSTAKFEKGRPLNDTVHSPSINVLKIGIGRVNVS